MAAIDVKRTPLEIMADLKRARAVRGSTSRLPSFMAISILLKQLQFQHVNLTIVSLRQSLRVGITGNCLT